MGINCFKATPHSALSTLSFLIFPSLPLCLHDPPPSLLLKDLFWRAEPLFILNTNYESRPVTNQAFFFVQIKQPRLLQMCFSCYLYFRRKPTSAAYYFPSVHLESKATLKSKDHLSIRQQLYTSKDNLICGSKAWLCCARIQLLCLYVCICHI